MTRILKYRYFKKLSKRIAKKFSAAECNPLGRDAVMGLRRFEEWYDKLPIKWQRWIDQYVEKAIERYHKPVAQGRDGEWYSAADMDHLMLRGA